MDPTTLAYTAVNLVAPYLGEMGKTAAARVGEGVAQQIEAVLQTIRRKVTRDDDSYGEQTLARWEEQPAVETRKQSLAALLAEKAQDDEAFARELAAIIEKAKADTGTLRFLTNVYGGEVGHLLNIGSVQTLHLGSNSDNR
jgi:streptomycin 6-kinase